MRVLMRKAAAKIRIKGGGEQAVGGRRLLIGGATQLRVGVRNGRGRRWQ